MEWLDFTNKINLMSVSLGFLLFSLVNAIFVFRSKTKNKVLDDAMREVMIDTEYRFTILQLNVANEGIGKRWLLHEELEPGMKVSKQNPEITGVIEQYDEETGTVTLRTGPATVIEIDHFFFYEETGD